MWQSQSTFFRIKVLYRAGTQKKFTAMGKASKVLVTIVILLVFYLLFGAIVSTTASGRPGIIGLILFAGLIGALRALWKSPKKDDSTNGKDDSILQK